jgi:predicted DNA-binding transcriptional regulator AlpA
MQTNEALSSVETTQAPKLMTCKEVCKFFGISTATLYRGMAQGDFPKPIRLTKGTVRWFESECQACLQSKGAERDADK